MKEVKIEFLKFPTHIQVNNPKRLTTKVKYEKIGYNKIYSGNLHFVLRSIMIKGMHKYLLKNIPKDIGMLKTPVETILEVHAPINYGNVKLLFDKNIDKHKISWKKPPDDFEPSWDLDNLVAAWIKTINDCIQKRGIVPNDNVRYITKKTEEFVPCEELDDRKLVLYIKTR
jgi:hypothetical protein